MSTPQNPLDGTGSSTYRHILIAFKYAEDAFLLNGPNNAFDPTSISVGGSLENIGPNVVVVNEFLAQEFSISEAMWSFDYIPNIGVSTTTTVGKIVVTDRYVPYGFLDFLSTSVLAPFNQKTDGDATVDENGELKEVDTSNLMSLGHATFVLKTIFTLQDNEGSDTQDITQPNPFYFNIDSVESVPNVPSISPTSHILHVMGSANTTGLLRSFSSLYQMNITHKDGNLHNIIPQANGTKGIKTRASENKTNTAKRKGRLDQSKPMLTLKDVFDGFASDLNQQKFVHAAQLQEWRRTIRDDNQPDKIRAAPQQTKLPDIDKLPIDFVIDLDSKYHEYNIDNRNMPFEQPEIGQAQVGIRVYPVRPGANIFELVDKLMLLSKQVGLDAIDPVSKKTHKTTITAKRLRKNKYVINVKIRQYELPLNGVTDNTGPGVYNDGDPLHFYINTPEELDTDVLEFKSHINYGVGDVMLEQQNTDHIGAGVVYADREQATAERLPSLPFFQTLYSGIRPMIASYGIDGLESAQRAGDIFNLMDRYTYTQTTDYELLIRGNPNLLSDLNRNPNDVIADIPGEGVFYYTRPEVDPMYVWLTIYLKAYSDGQDVQEKFYFDGYYHLARVVNMFGIIGDKRGFYQKLLLKRSDTLI